jgi:multiple sugar transport system permease protein
MGKRHRLCRRWAADLALPTVAGAFALPLAWLVLASLDARAGLRVRVPDEVTFGNYRKVLTDDITHAA